MSSVANRSIEMTAHGDALRLEALGLMTAGIVHDLGNMVQVLSSAINILGRAPQVRDSAALQPVISEAIGSLNGASGLVRQIMGFARDEVLDVRPVDVALALAGLERLLRWLCPMGVKITMRLGSDLPPVICNKHKLENAILNLVLNARDVMPTGGMISIAAHLSRGDQNELIISVCDDGPGMSPETIAVAFDPFFTTKAEGRGTGLGLPMVRRFAQELNGSASIVSRQGIGTTVTLRLPAEPLVMEHD